MIRPLRNWLGVRFGSDDTDGGESDDSRFVPSLLDASVRFAHGGSNSELEGEIGEIQDEAHRLESERRP